jgi:hypothetical protein
MIKLIKSTVLLLAFGAVSQLACGPSCPEAKSALSETEMASEDAFRVNQLVSRRKMVMKEAKAPDVDQFKMQDIKLSVDAYKFAIQMQLRIIMISPEGTQPSELYGKNAMIINDYRCVVDDLLEKKLLVVTKYEAAEVKDYHTRFKKTFRKDGELSTKNYERYYEDGIKPISK